MLPAASQEVDEDADAAKAKAAKAASNAKRAKDLGVGSDSVSLRMGGAPIRTPTTVAGWVSLGVPEAEARKHVAK